MSVYQSAAVHILGLLHRAEDDLVGRAAVTFNGETGTVRALELDEDHGLCFTFDDPFVSPFNAVERDVSRRFYPVSTIKRAM